MPVAASIKGSCTLFLSAVVEPGLSGHIPEAEARVGQVRVFGVKTLQGALLAAKSSDIFFIRSTFCKSPMPRMLAALARSSAWAAAFSRTSFSDIDSNLFVSNLPGS